VNLSTWGHAEFAPKLLIHCILPPNGRENTSSFWASSFGPENNGQNSTQNKATMVNCPPPPFIMNGRHQERPPRRPAQSISSADSGERSVAARWSWAARGLSSGRFAVAGTCFCTVWGRILEIPPQSTWMSVLEAPSSLICIGYRRESSELSGDAEKWSNCKIGGNIMHE